MKSTDWPVIAADVRPGGQQGKCFYCQIDLGEQHKAACVLRRRTVVCKVKIDIVLEYPESWSENDINFHLNESSSCSDNIAQKIIELSDCVASGCLCGHLEAEYLREATEEDEKSFGEFACSGVVNPVRRS